MKSTLIFLFKAACVIASISITSMISYDLGLENQLQSDRERTQALTNRTEAAEVAYNDLRERVHNLLTDRDREAVSRTTRSRYSSLPPLPDMR